MFVQIIQGTAQDRDGLRRQWESWQSGLRGGAAGYLGSAAGITSSGDFVAAVRFDSEEAARRNSDRPEQSEWWEKTAATLQDIHFDESSDVTVLSATRSDDPGFVQMMRAKVKDRRRFEEIEDEIGALFMEHRPDAILGYRVWLAGGVVHVVDYFTSEAEARAGEQKEMPEELRASFGEWMGLLEDTTWYDLPEPWIDNP